MKYKLKKKQLKNICKTKCKLIDQGQHWIVIKFKKTLIILLLNNGQFLVLEYQTRLSKSFMKPIKSLMSYRYGIVLAFSMFLVFFKRLQTHFIIWDCWKILGKWKLSLLFLKGVSQIQEEWALNKLWKILCRCLKISIF